MNPSVDDLFTYVKQKQEDGTLWVVAESDDLD
jgi:hypothetical protein